MTEAVKDSAARPWMSVKEASKHTGISEHALRKEIGAGRLRALRMGSRAFRILPNDLDDFAAKLVYKPE